MAESLTTAPKPFVFVLMPLDPEFKDIYKFGIKGAAEEVGAYAERVDEQMFSEGILERIFNQISKADVVVADMTSRNPNVFYEVGYAHALDKVVVLLTQKADDIPFDLKHQQHIVYGGSIDRLKSDLKARLTWAIEESRRRSRGEAARYQLTASLAGMNLPEISLGAPLPSVSIETGGEKWINISIHIRNDGPGPSDPVSHLYLFTDWSPVLGPIRVIQEILYRDMGKYGGAISERVNTPLALEWMRASAADEATLGLPLQYRLPEVLPSIPPGAVDLVKVYFKKHHDIDYKKEPHSLVLCVRFHTPARVLNFPFQLAVSERQDT